MSPGPEDVVDARGLRCPLPVINLARAAAGRPPGTVVRVLATDPAARADIPAWVRMRGHAVTATDEGDHTAFEVVLGPHQGEGGTASAAGSASR